MARLALSILVAAVACCDALVAVPARPSLSFRSVAAAPAPAVARRATETEGEIFEVLESEEAADDLAPAKQSRLDFLSSSGGDDDDDDDETQQTRVFLYMGFSLLPIIALLPFLGSRDFIPADPSLYT